MKRFSSTTDVLAGSIIPGFVAILAVVTGIAGYFASQSAKNEPAAYMGFFAPVLLGGLLITFYGYKPLGITITTAEVGINRKLAPVSIPYSEISTVQLLEDKDLSGAVRTFGNGGLFGYTGKYYKNPFGSMTWYCTQRKNYLLIEKKDGKKIVITPDQPLDLLASLKEHAPHLFA